MSREDVIDKIVRLVGGHPYLLHVLMYAARLSGKTLRDLIDDADELDRLFGNQLSALARLLEREPRIEKAIRSVIATPEQDIDDDLFVRLRRAGVVTRAGRGYMIRYGLYRDYLLRRWHMGKK